MSCPHCNGPVTYITEMSAEGFKSGVWCRKCHRITYTENPEEVKP